MSDAAAPVGRFGRLLAWLGGVVFAGALLYFAYSYLVAWGSPSGLHFRAAEALRRAPADVASRVLFNAGLFTVFALHHSALARVGAKRWIRRYVAPPLERSLYVWVASALFILTCAWWQPIPGTVWALQSPWHWAGWALQACGLWLTIDATRAIDALELAGIRQVAGGRTNATLQARASYRWVRHPIYLGWVLFTFGAPEMTGTRFTFACVSALYLLIAIPLEERGLVSSFGDAYVDYRRQVRWRLIPGVY
jgi:protein-S-isoprenylcysteine O-methyltransferase Ste14